MRSLFMLTCLLIFAFDLCFGHRRLSTMLKPHCCQCSHLGQTNLPTNTKVADTPGSLLRFRAYSKDCPVRKYYKYSIRCEQSSKISMKQCELWFCPMCE
ncbi:hypothetical protein L596_026083 [Steinernema carpocapsae]|uniref:Uncharacterized protein n=1 Tax=Steinernema carpocapsae TaxID=34508 RepID=A0A4U5M0A2_STECR|nr:hypothetical protein L596_026083 [Steinernema carpocapsae]